MLAKQNRVVSATDFRLAMRKGRKAVTAHTFIHVVKVGDAETRFGFIVSKVVGNAVKRNVVKRRLREIGAEFIDSVPTGYIVVIRPVAGAADLTWSELHAEVAPAIRKVTAKI